MPFTPSHAVVALPFVRTPLVPAAIAIGAMTPDLPLFVRGLPLHYGRTHDLTWIGATVVLALVLLLVWRCLLRPAVRELSPRRLAERLPQEWDAPAAGALRETIGYATSGGFSGRALMMTVLSLVLGIVTHIVWDLFTHEGRWGVELVPLLDDRWGPLAGYTWLQHGSSVLGLAIIGVWMLVWFARADAVAPIVHVLPAWGRGVWWLTLPGILIGGWCWGLAQFGPLDDDFTVAHLAYRVLPPACAVWGIVTVVLAIFVQVRRSALSRAALASD